MGNQVQIYLSKMIKFLLLYYIMAINCQDEPLVLSGSQIVFNVDKIDEKTIDKYLETLSESQNSEEPQNTFPCPSRQCWEYRDNECHLKADGCIKIDCGEQGMKLEISNTLLKTNPSNPPRVIVKSKKCAPKLKNGKWIWNVNLGQCGMVTENSSLNGEPSVTFELGVRSRKQLYYSKARLWPTFLGSDDDLTYNFICHYPALVKPEAVNYHSSFPQSQGTTIHQFGSFTNAFNVKIFKEPDFKKVLSGASLYIGHMVYVQVLWDLPSLYHKLQFYVDECSINRPDLDNKLSVSIIKDNCYSCAVDAGILTKSHFVRRKAKFRYRSFAIQRKSVQNLETMTCTLRICMMGKDNKCTLNLKDNDCPQDEGFEYGVYGKI